VNRERDFIVLPDDLRLLCRVARGLMSASAARVALAGRGWSHRDAVDFVALVNESAGAPLWAQYAYEISTRRQVGSGAVHEMADLGVDFLCGRVAPEPFHWTNAHVTCRDCLRVMAKGPRNDP
jgi:hypothetical protein